MMFASGFSWFNLIPAVDHNTLLAPLGLAEFNQTYVHAWFAVVLLVVFAVLARMGLERAKKRDGVQRFFSDERPSFLLFAELVASFLKNLMGDSLDRKDVRAFFPFIATIFLYVLTCNLMGLVPGFQPPTSNINANVGMAMSVFVVFNYVGLSRDPVGYIKHLMGPVWWLVPLMFTIELVSVAARPVTLSLRLMANMFGDHLVFGLINDLSLMGPIPIPVAFPMLLLGMLVSTIQAFIFALLSTVYIQLSLPHHDHDH